MLRVNVKERKLCFNQNYVDEEGRKVCVIATKIVVEGERWSEWTEMSFWLTIVLENIRNTTVWIDLSWMHCKLNIDVMQNVDMVVACLGYFRDVCVCVLCVCVKV